MENIFRTIGYLILFVINALLFYFLHSHFHFIVLVLMIVAPVISVCMAIILRKHVTAEVVTATSSAKGNYGTQNEEAYFYLRFHNPSPFVSLDTKVKVVVRNTFFGTEGEQIFSIPIHAGKGYELMLPIIPKLPGIVQIEIKSIRIKDLMGVCYLNKDITSAGEITVMPELLPEMEYDKTALEIGMLESEESTKRGSDFSDVNEIREYIPGDKLMNIHWKLSAKRDILMVKDRVSMSDRQLVVLPELCGGSPELLNMILVSAYSVIMQLINDKTTVRLMYWSAARYEYEDKRIDYKEDLNDAFAGMFYENTYSSMDEAASHMPLVHPEMKAYLHVTADGRGAVIRVKENG